MPNVINWLIGENTKKGRKDWLPLGNLHSEESKGLKSYFSSGRTMGVFTRA